jgi:RecA-family ATPase
MSIIDLELSERLSAPISIEGVRDLSDWWAGGSKEPQISPPLSLGWDIHRQWPNDEGFALWRDLMHVYEPPLLAAELMEGDQRQAVSVEQYEATLLENWALYDREKHWTDQLIVDVMHDERQREYEPCGAAWERTEAILNDLAAKCGAKRAAVLAEKDARESRRRKRLDKYFELDDAGYAKWTADGRPYSDAKKVERWTERHYFELVEKVKSMPVVPFPSQIQPEQRIRPRRINAASLSGKAIPQREWLVPGLIPTRNVTLLYGDGGTGKSLLALQLAAAKASGSSFFGRPMMQGGVEFVTAEDEQSEMHRRLIDISRSMGKGLDAMAGLHLTSLADQDALLAIPADGRGGTLEVTNLYQELKQILAESKPTLVVLDTLADIYGGNEIVRAQVRQFAGLLRRLAVDNGCTIVVLAHPSLSGMDKGTSGSTGWSNSVRSRLFFTRVLDADGTEPDEDLRMLRVGKSNYGRTGLEIPMRWKNGVFVEEGGAAGPDPLSQQWKADRVFLEMLDKANEQNTHVSASVKANNYAPKVFVRDALKQGVKKRDLVDAMQRLLDGAKIENAPYGPPSRTSYRLQRVNRPTVLAPPL